MRTSSAQRRILDALAMAPRLSARRGLSARNSASNWLCMSARDGIKALQEIEWLIWGQFRALAA